jgi:pimeloyl-ACP methyl ester carboxylesterase
MQDDTSGRALGRRHVASVAGSLTLGAVALASAASAQTLPQVAGLPVGVTATLIGRWDVARLNRILASDMPAFSGVAVDYPAARNAVRLYRVTYPSVVPELGNKPVVLTGLLAIPEVTPTTLPLVSYQHGTVYGKQEVPSYPENSPETQLMIALFAGQGYLLVGADYVGMGDSREPQGYMVKASHQQATADMLPAARAVIAANGLRASQLFLGGWSQGGYVTMAMLERLEQIGVPVRAAATASAPVDPWIALNGFLNFPRPIDAPWVGTLFILASFSFENYYGVPGLARSLLKAEHYEVCRSAYEGQAVDPARIPTNLRDLVAEPYFDAPFFARSSFGQLISANQAYRWVIRTPVGNFYGEADEVITPGLGRMAMEFQRAMGNDKVEAISTGPTSHRGTYARAAAEWKRWFDSLAAG